MVKPKDRIAYKLIVCILLFSGAVTICVTGIQLYHEYRIDIRDIRTQIRRVEESFIGPLTTALWFFNEEYIRLQLEGMLQLRDIEYLVVREGEDIIASLGKAVSERQIRQTIPLVYRYNDRDRQIGELHMVAGLDGVYDRLLARFLIILVTQGAKTLLVSGFMFLLFQWMMTRHLSTIAGYLGRFDLKRESPPLQLDRRRPAFFGGPDEFDGIVRAINETARYLHSTYEAVEEKVRERTAALTAANESLKKEIAERRRVEKALRESESIFQKLAEGIEDVFWLMTVDKKAPVYRYISPALQKWGISPEQLIQNPMAWLDYIHPEDRKKVISRFGALLKKGGNYDVEYRIIIPDGRERWIWDRGFALEKEASDARYVGGIAKDVTEYKRLQNHQLRVQTLEAIASLAGGIAHQFNNALFAIMGNVELLESSLGENHEVSEHTEPVKESADRLAYLTRQLLAYARGGKYQPQQVSLNELVRNAVTFSRHILPAETSMETDLESDLPPIRADANQIQMVISEILKNAAEAVDEKGTIRIRTRHRSDFCKKVQSGDVEERPVCLGIIDNGEGMEKKTLQRIFEPFFTTRFQGRGLGMAAAYGIVKNHEGVIHVESVPGNGTEVCICFPAAGFSKTEESKENSLLFP